MTALGAAGAAPSAPWRHVVLVGLPGAGKSTVGAAVAEAMRRPFVDFDAVIEREAGRRVSELFAEYGEAHFRALEATLSERLAAAGEACVLAPGGGWAANASAVAALRPRSWVVWLTVGVDEALRRIRAQGGGRPLLAGVDPEAALATLLAARQPQYAAADAQVGTEGLTVAEVVRRVVLVASQLPGSLANRPVSDF